MTATLEQTQNELARLIRMAANGQEVVITEAGQPVARLVAINEATVPPDRSRWLKMLRDLRETTSARPGKSSDEMLSEDRAGRP